MDNVLDVTDSYINVYIVDFMFHFHQVQKEEFGRTRRFIRRDTAREPETIVS
ncbi:hypothetical protein NT6N_24670 [Oceaniferula spumae]|uniref:Uncharacterized protein n=1 Tax=Oceaniferula spumae TaxID=2979115 RepID=A0AAT9FND9_9BACT